MVKMVKFAPQITVAGSICIALLVGVACLFFPRKVQQFAVHWPGYGLLGRPKWLLKFIQSDGYVTHLRFIGAYFLASGAILFSICLKVGFFSR